MKWRQALLLGAIAFGSLCLVTCNKKEEKDHCQKLIEQQVKCDFKNGAALDADAQKALVETCRKEQKTVQMRTALNCLKAHECRTFLTCRKEADELKGLKTMF